MFYRSDPELVGGYFLLDGQHPLLSMSLLCFTGLALDWVMGNLYWTDSTNAYIKMSRKDGRFQQVLIEKGINNPLGIAVHPSRG